MKHWLISLGAAGALTVSTSAMADPPPSPVPRRVDATPKWKIEQKKEALRREAEGLADKGQWKEAIEKFQAMLALGREGKTLLWIGYCEEQLGSLLVAKAIYQRARTEAHAVGNKEDESGASQALAAIGPKIPRIEVNVPAGVAAEIRLDDRQFPDPHAAIEVDPGTHVLVVSAPGRKIFHLRFDLKSGETKRVMAQLEPKPQSELTPLPPPPLPEPTPTPVLSDKQDVPVAPAVVGTLGGISSLAGMTLLVAGGLQRVPVQQYVGGGLLGGGLIVTGGCVVWGFLDKKPSSHSDAARRRVVINPSDVAVTPLSGGGWVSVTGRF
ncbi:MAG: hypothetical protein U0359_06430 [Byssovorax sp.]